MNNRKAIAGVLFLVLAIIIWRTEQPLAQELRLSPLTFDPGLTGWPAISADGLQVAYASDRDTGRNLELYAQPIPRGTAVRLTNGSDDHSDPSFSPDGATLAFQSTRNGGGIYSIPTAGGEPRLLAAGGHAPRYSPDGRWISYWTSEGAYLLPAGGGEARRFHSEIPSVRAMAWSPDGASLAFWSRDDLWVASISGGSPVSTGLGERLRKLQASGPLTDVVWTKSDFIFSLRTGFVRNLYRCRAGGGGRVSGDPIRLTNSTEAMSGAAISRYGRIVLTAGRQRFDIWGVPLDPASGKASGPAYRITDTLAPTANPDLSPDGKRLLFGSSRNGFTEIWEKDLASGREWVAASGPEGASYGRFLPGTEAILCVKPSRGRDDLYAGDRKLAEGARGWSSDLQGTLILASGGGIDTVNILSKERKTIIPAPAGARLSDASFSPDGQWILFREESAGTSRIYVAPAAGGVWVAITDTILMARGPRFSTSGDIIYFTAERDGTREIDGIRFNGRKGAAVGAVFVVLRPAGGGLSLSEVNPQALSIGVGRDKLAAILCEEKSALWMGELVLK